MIEAFIIRAVISSVLLSFTSGAIGSFIIWQRMAYAGDSLAHSAMLGVALSLVLNMPILPGVILVSILAALIVVKLMHNQKLMPDSSLGLCAQFSIAFSMLIISLIKSQPIDIMGFLFGDIIATTNDDIYALLILAGVIIIWVIYRWHALILKLISPELLFIQKKITRQRLDLEFMVVTALLVAISIKIVGILLISALLIIPALSAQVWRLSPSHTVLLSAAFGCAADFLGIILSYYYDTITGPTIVVSAVGLFILSSSIRYVTKKPLFFRFIP